MRSRTRSRFLVIALVLALTGCTAGEPPAAEPTEAALPTAAETAAVVLAGERDIPDTYARQVVDPTRGGAASDVLADERGDAASLEIAPAACEVLFYQRPVITNDDGVADSVAPLDVYTDDSGSLIASHVRVFPDAASATAFATALAAVAESCSGGYTATTFATSEVVLAYDAAPFVGGVAFTSWEELGADTAASDDTRYQFAAAILVKGALVIRANCFIADDRLDSLVTCDRYFDSLAAALAAIEPGAG